MVSGESLLTIKQGSFDDDSTNRVYPVEDEKLALGQLCRLHAIAHGGDIGVKAATDILNVEYQGINVLEKPGRGFARCTIKAVDFQPGFAINTIVNFSLSSAADAVLGTK